jgi:lipopolysaccharide/colanic/teichoic acid biosynthesis glycosyltransferase
VSTEIYLPQLQESLLRRNSPGIKANALRQQEILDVSIESVQPVQTYHVSPWCSSVSKRVFDLICVVPALIVFSPGLAIVAFAVRLTSTGPVIFRQQRAGRRRKLFTIYKFRTMVENSEAMGPGHTAKGDPRITPIGNFLRRFKLDELPQLYNVLRGDMSLVGPRPKLPHHDNTLLVCRPGVTGAATLAFRDEQRILCEVPAENLEDFYQQHVVPRKLSLDADYMSQATLATDLGVLFATLARGGNSLTHKDLFASPVRPSQSRTARSPIALQRT